MASAMGCWIFISTIALSCLDFGVGQIVVNHERGKNLPLKCDVPGAVDSITWKHGNDKIVEWSQGETKAEWYKSQGFTGNLKIENGDVELFNLSRGGKFTCEILLGSTVNSKSKEVVIWDKPLKPKVTCERNETHITLHCQVNTKASETVKWSGPNGLSSTDDTLVINKKIDKNSIFYCNANNPATTSETEYNLQDCKDTFPDSSESNVGMTLGIVLGIILVILIAIGLGVYFYKERLADFFGLNNRQPDDESRPETHALNDPNDKNNTDPEKNNK